MDIDHPADLSQANRRVLGLMRLLTHFNTGAILALCFWLAWAAWQTREPVAPADMRGLSPGCPCSSAEASSGVS